MFELIHIPKSYDKLFNHSLAEFTNLKKNAICEKLLVLDSDQGSSQANHRSSVFPQLIQIKFHPQLCSRSLVATLLPCMSIFSGSHRSSPLNFFPNTSTLSLPPTPAGFPWEHTGHSSQGSRQANCISSPLFPYFKLSSPFSLLAL